MLHEYQFRKTNSKVFFNIGKATRFATIKDRYSFRLGTALPNPDLLPEDAINIELGVEGKAKHHFGYKASIFNAEISNTIQQVDRVFFDTATKSWLAQQQNTGKSRFYGAELQLSKYFSKNIHFGLNYSYIERTNLSNPAILFTHVPKHNIFIFGNYTYKKDYWINLNARYNSERISQSYGVTADAFAILNTKLHAKVFKAFALEMGINNITDRNYAYTEGFPEPGRNYSVSLVWNASLN